MECPNCGENIVEGGTFCPECGTKIEQAPVEELVEVEGTVEEKPIKQANTQFKHF